MSEASRLDQMLRESDRERFDVAHVVASSVEGYRGAYRERKFDVQLPGGQVMINGAPAAIAQLLNKLVSKSVDFSAPDSTIKVELAVAEGQVKLIVSNGEAPCCSPIAPIAKGGRPA